MSVFLNNLFTNLVSPRIIQMFLKYIHFMTVFYITKWFLIILRQIQLVITL